MLSASTPPKPVNEPTLLGLPLELRRQIYRELFISNSHSDPCHWDTHHPHLKDPDFPQRYCNGCNLPVPPHSLNYSLLLACRQVYEEALPILYEETTFYETNGRGRDFYGGPQAKAPPERLSKLKHLRFEVTSSDCEHEVAESIRILAQYCPLLEDLELQVEFLLGESAGFWYDSSPEGELVKLLPSLNLRYGFSLTIKDEYFIPADVAHEFRLAIAPDEKWHCNGWDYTFNGNGYGWVPKWVRMWSLGGSGTMDLRFLDEPSKEDIEQIQRCYDVESYFIDRLAAYARVRASRFPVTWYARPGRRLSELWGFIIVVVICLAVIYIDLRM